jgi:hypothetical protein
MSGKGYRLLTLFLSLLRYSQERMTLGPQKPASIMGVGPVLVPIYWMRVVMPFPGELPEGTPPARTAMQSGTLPVNALRLVTSNSFESCFFGCQILTCGLGLRPATSPGRTQAKRSTRTGDLPTSRRIKLDNWTDGQTVRFARVCENYSAILNPRPVL